MTVPPNGQISRKRSHIAIYTKSKVTSKSKPASAATPRQKGTTSSATRITTPQDFAEMAEYDLPDGSQLGMIHPPSLSGGSRARKRLPGRKRKAPTTTSRQKSSGQRLNHDAVETSNSIMEKKPQKHSSIIYKGLPGAEDADDPIEDLVVSTRAIVPRLKGTVTTPTNYTPTARHREEDVLAESVDKAPCAAETTTPNSELFDASGDTGPMSSLDENQVPERASKRQRRSAATSPDVLPFPIKRSPLKQLDCNAGTQVITITTSEPPSSPLSELSSLSDMEDSVAGICTPVGRRLTNGPDYEQGSSSGLSETSGNGAMDKSSASSITALITVYACTPKAARFQCHNTLLSAFTSTTYHRRPVSTLTSTTYQRKPVLSEVPGKAGVQACTVMACTTYECGPVSAPAETLSCFTQATHTQAPVIDRLPLVDSKSCSGKGDGMWIAQILDGSPTKKARHDIDHETSASAYKHSTAGLRDTLVHDVDLSATKIDGREAALQEASSTYVADSIAIVQGMQEDRGQGVQRLDTVLRQREVNAVDVIRATLQRLSDLYG